MINGGGTVALSGQPRLARARIEAAARREHVEAYPLGAQDLRGRRGDPRVPRVENDGDARPEHAPGPVGTDLERRRFVDPDADAIRVLEDRGEQAVVAAAPHEVLIHDRSREQVEAP